MVCYASYSIFMLLCFIDLEEEDEEGKYENELNFKGGDSWGLCFMRRWGYKLLRATGNQSVPEAGSIENVMDMISRILDVPEIDLHHLFSADETKFLLYMVKSRSIVHRSSRQNASNKETKQGMTIMVGFNATGKSSCAIISFFVFLPGFSFFHVQARSRSPSTASASLRTLIGRNTCRLMLSVT